MPSLNMTMGIIRPSGTEDCPGTVLLFERADNEQSYHSGAKHDPKDPSIILDPQPSDDPNDPLKNWSIRRKDLLYLTIFVNTVILAAVPGPVFASSTAVMSKSLGVSLDNVALLSGYQLLVVGLYGPFCSALARKYGKRPQYLFGCTMALIGTIICVAAGSNYTTLLAGRIIQGFGTTAFESLSLAAIGDVYFVHERGIRTGVMAIALTCLSSMVNIIGGPITQTLGWRYMLIIQLPFVAAAWILTFFFIPETQFRRSVGNLEHTEMPVQNTDSKEKTEEGSEVYQEENVDEQQTTHPSTSVAKRTYVQNLAIFSGTYTDTAAWKLIAAPFVVLHNPSVIWSLGMTGIVVALWVSLAYVFAQLWSASPYNLNAAQNGYFYVGAMAGGMIGGLGSAWVTDLITKIMVRINRGIYEPEFRILTQVISGTFMALGYFVFVWLFEHPFPTGYFLGSFLHGCICLGITVSTVSASLYMLDAHASETTEIFSLQMIFKNLLFFGFSHFVNSWAAKDGAQSIFRTYGIVAVCLTATSIPMYIFGKRNRLFIHKLGVLRRFYTGKE
ncbi:Major facilitator superfamily domain general substrate transporter [Penicillium concentricum]|uniref:Major facilitator superfamily domain general substrate transporter n=1 Tax=Penicillium concentricum TaxID=293559 RepID=A0A9W9VA38_9EURO|nr:Major facilitator superfamily domain general substrate transporter [Penicillium concentricum]KAJ5371831.1 Major facilitator superfamily domain general substrate transporter [Penicillium concentricum]